MWFINGVQPLRIVPWLWMRYIEKSDNGAAIRTHIFITIPVFVVIVVLVFVVRLLKRLLVERIFDAFVENSLGVVRSFWSFRSRNCVVKTELVEKGWQVVRMVFNVEFLVEEMLNLLFFPGLSLTQQFNQFLLLGLVELRGPAAPEVRRELPQSSFIPAVNPVASCAL
jgi:hypothetical protein